MAKISENLTEGPLFKGILRYSMPVLASGILQLLFNAADLVVVGQFCGSISVAAVGATTSVTVLMINFFMGISVGSGVLVAQGLGAKDHKQVEQTVHTSIPLAALFGLFVSVAGVILSPWILQVMDTPETVLPLSNVYMRIYFCGQIFHLIYNFGAAILRAAGDTKGPLIYLTAAGVMNFSLNLVFVILFRMDVAGVALATALSHTLSAFLVMGALMRREDACRFSFRKIRLHWDLLKRMLRIGVPTGISSSMFSVANVMIQSTVNSFGDMAVAGNSAAASIGGFVYTSVHAYQYAAMNYAGQNSGANKPERVKRSFLYCLLCTMVTGLVVGGLANIFAEPLLGIYLKDAAPEALEMGKVRLLLVCLPYGICGLQEIAGGTLRGLGHSLAPMVASLVGVVGFRIGWILWVVRAVHTPQMLYLSFPISWVIVFLVDLILLAVIFKKGMQRE